LFSWTEYKPRKQRAETVLRSLESEIMNIMWREKRATVRTIYTLVKNKHSVNRTSVNVTMGLLCKRGMLTSSVSRGKGGLKYIYKVKISRRRFEREVVGKVLDSLLESFERTARKQMRERLKRS